MERQLDVKNSSMPHYNLLLVHHLPLLRDVIELALGVEWKFDLEIYGTASLEHVFGMGHAHLLGLCHRSLSDINFWIDI